MYIDAHAHLDRFDHAGQGGLIGCDMTIPSISGSIEITSVANVTRADVDQFFQLAAEIPIRPTVGEYPLADANRALVELRTQTVEGAKVLRVR
jgi:D-arabinose 1-dehydrogenase-like Zn-dependent alcohol dehydrogenase